MDHDSWVGVEVRHLTALSAVAREGSFRAAADRLGYVQSAVSQQVANLERLVGVRLVDRFRGSKEVHVTEAGEVLLEHAEEILARLRAARADLASRADAAGGGTLRVGVSQSVASGLLPAILRRLAGTTPDLRVTPVEANGDGPLLDLVERGAVDVALTDHPLESGCFESCTILSDPCVVLVAAGSEWADRAGPPTLQELAGLPLIALDGWPYQSQLEAWFAAQSLSPRFVLRAETEATARAFVAAGLGAAIVPSLGAGRDDRRLAVIDLAGIVPTRRVALYWHRSRQPRQALLTLREIAQTVALELDNQHRGRGRSTPPVALAAA